MEYALPTMLIVVVIVATANSIGQILDEYFLQGSGHAAGDLQGGTLQTRSMGSTASGSPSTGSGATMATVSN